MDGPKILSLLQPLLSSSAQFSLADDAGTNIGLKRWTDWKSPSFIATVKPITVEDVQTTVKWATKNIIPFLSVATGHGYNKAYTKVKDALQIDISSFKAIEIDAKADTITIGGAVLFREVLDPLFNAGKEMIVGSCSSTGIIGVTLGGGINRWQGLYGTLVDNLLEVQIVTANGSLVTASKTENAELFWGIRGAGTNFGIVVAATYRTYDLQNDGLVMNADMIFPYEKSGEIVKILKGFEGRQPAELAIGTCALWHPEMGACHLVNTYYMGSLAAGTALIQPFLDLGPLMKDIKLIPWNEISAQWGFGSDKELSAYGGLKNPFTGHVKTLDVPTFEWYFARLKKLWEEYPACRESLGFIEDWPTQKMSEIPDDECAFSHRDVECQMIFMCASSDPSLAEMLDKWGREVYDRFEATNGFGEPRVYVSYGQGDESQETLFGARKLDRLRALKREWDAEEVFSFNHPIKI